MTIEYTSYDAAIAKQEENKISQFVIYEYKNNKSANIKKDLLGENYDLLESSLYKFIIEGEEVVFLYLESLEYALKNINIDANLEKFINSVKKEGIKFIIIA